MRSKRNRAFNRRTPEKLFPMHNSRPLDDEEFESLVAAGEFDPCLAGERAARNGDGTLATVGRFWVRPSGSPERDGRTEVKHYPDGRSFLEALRSRHDEDGEPFRYLRIRDDGKYIFVRSTAAGQLARREWKIGLRMGISVDQKHLRDGAVSDEDVSEVEDRIRRRRRLLYGRRRRKRSRRRA